MLTLKLSVVLIQFVSVSIFFFWSEFVSYLFLYSYTKLFFGCRSVGVCKDICKYQIEQDAILALQ